MRCLPTPPHPVAPPSSPRVCVSTPLPQLQSAGQRQADVFFNALLDRIGATLQSLEIECTTEWGVIGAFEEARYEAKAVQYALSVSGIEPPVALLAGGMGSVQLSGLECVRSRHAFRMRIGAPHRRRLALAPRPRPLALPLAPDAHPRTLARDRPHRPLPTTPHAHPHPAARPSHDESASQRMRVPPLPSPPPPPPPCSGTTSFDLPLRDGTAMVKSGDDGLQRWEEQVKETIHDSELAKQLRALAAFSQDEGGEPVRVVLIGAFFYLAQAAKLVGSDLHEIRSSDYAYQPAAVVLSAVRRVRNDPRSDPRQRANAVRLEQLLSELFSPLYISRVECLIARDWQLSGGSDVDFRTTWSAGWWLDRLVRLYQKVVV